MVMLSSYTHRESDASIFCFPPLLGALLFDNTDSDARDHCANERTFLSYLRLSVYMSVVAIAVIVSFHLKSEPTPLERKMAKPLGIVFWFLAVCCLALGAGNYMKTVNKYFEESGDCADGMEDADGRSILSFLQARWIGISYGEEALRGHLQLASLCSLRAF